MVVGVLTFHSFFSGGCPRFSFFFVAVLTFSVCFCYSGLMNRKNNLSIFIIGLWLLVNPVFAEEPEFQRVIDLRGTSNTRDIGGYKTTDGRTINWRQIIRSDRLSRLTPEDFQKLEELGLRTVVDLRTVRENEKDPTVWEGENPPQFFHFPVGDSNGPWFKKQKKLLSRNRFTEEEMLEHMMSGYQMVAEVGSPSYEKLMEVVLDESNWPILIHCSAGKDRAGVATTLILEALGVDRDTIMKDYLLTNEVSQAERKASILSKDRENYTARVGTRMGSGKGPPPKAFFPLVGVAPEMLETYYTSVEEQYGSVDAYLAEIGMDQAGRTALKQALTSSNTELVASAGE
jgi:protein-tyrosine phosphatase